MSLKPKLATIYTKSHTYYIHSDLTWGRYKIPRSFSKGIKTGRVFQIDWASGAIITTEFKSIEDAFTTMGADFNSKPEFDLKSLRAWADYVLG